MRIPMRTIWISALALTLAACGGNYSNEDVEFLNALPHKTELESNLTPPPDGGTPALLGEQPLLVVRRAESQLAVGDVSAFALATEGASQGFNQFLFSALDLLEAVTQLPPSQRSAGERTWGPFPDDKHPGYQVRLVMQRTDTQFTYQVEVQPVGASDWLAILAGEFRATSGLRKGQGDLHLFIAKAQTAGYSMNADPNVDTIDASYRTDVPPTVVTLTVSAVGNPVPVFAYQYAGQADGSGQMGFALVDSANQNALEAVGRWTSSGSGRGDAVVISGAQVGATWTECWDAANEVVYSFPSWSPPAVGDPAQCAFTTPPS